MRKFVCRVLGFGVPALIVLVGCLWIGVVVQKAAARPNPQAESALFTDAELAMHANMYKSIGTAEIEAAEHLSESDIVELAGHALEGLMESSFQGWRAGFENYLRVVLEMTDEEIVVAVYGVYAFRSVLLANALLAELGP